MLAWVTHCSTWYIGRGIYPTWLHFSLGAELEEGYIPDLVYKDSLLLVFAVFKAYIEIVISISHVLSKDNIGL